MADLSWFPHTPAKWRTRTAGVSVLAEFAYMRLRDHAWEAPARGKAPCTLPDDDKALALMSGLGAAWSDVASEVRSLLTTANGMLVDTFLLSIWEKQQALYEARKDAGGKGGRAKAKAAREAKQKETNTTTEDVAKSKQKPTKATASPQHQELVVPSGTNSNSVPEGDYQAADEVALAPVGAALPAANGTKPPGKLLPQDAKFAASLLKPATPTPGALSREESVAETQRQVETRARRVAIVRHYWEQIGAKYDTWANANERHATRLEDAAREHLKIKVGEKLHPQQAKELRHEVLRQWRDSAQSPWIPDLDTYIAEQEAKLVAPAQQNGMQPHVTH